MHIQRRHAIIVCITFFSPFMLAARSGAADATIGAGNYRWDLTVMGQTTGEDVVVEYQDKTIIIRKPMQAVEYAFQGTIEGDRLTAETKGAGATFKLAGKVTAQNLAEGTATIITSSGMEIAGTFKLSKK